MNIFILYSNGDCNFYYKNIKYFIKKYIVDR